MENVDIERAHRIMSADKTHRVMSADKNKSTVIVKCTKYKDREQILSAAKKSLKNTQYIVKEDFSEHLK